MYYKANSAEIIGDVTIGDDVTIWHQAVIRGDRDSIVIGNRSNVQDGCILHLEDGCPINIGEGVTIGHRAIVHGCVIGDNTTVGMGAIVMNRAVVGKNCIIGAGALIPEGKEIPDNSIVVGMPGKVVKECTLEQIEHNRVNADFYVNEGKLVLKAVE
ncbi:MAG: gamma carbonic anhydrase family protein [Pseudobutyrivibrio sp.]|nr:gamma carbonic anhydrase family protein [Pseudobutyrivibrio sp.]